MTEIQLLRDPETAPTEKVLEAILGKEIYAVYDRLIQIITGEEFGIKPEWNYYNDGKAWLCKAVYKKKTVFWLSVWENQIKISFYFTEKNASGIFDLPIDERLKQQFGEAKAIGRLIPFCFHLQNAGQLEELKTVIQYKKSLK